MCRAFGVLNESASVWKSIWTAIFDHTKGVYCKLWKDLQFFLLMMPQINFYNHNMTPQTVLCSFIITVFVQLRLHWSMLLSHSSLDIWLQPNSKSFGKWIFHPLVYLSSNFFRSTCKFCHCIKSNYSCHVLLISLCPKTILSINRNVDNSN